MSHRIETVTEEDNGYIAESPDFTLYISNEAKFGAEYITLIVSIPDPDSEEGPPPSQTIKLNGTIIIPDVIPCTWGIPNATKVNGDTYEMPPHDTFPDYYAMYYIGPLDSYGEVIAIDVNITGSPPVEFNAWGFNSDDRIILKNPFSHSLTHVPEFPAIALPIAGIIGLVYLFRRKEE